VVAQGSKVVGKKERSTLVEGGDVTATRKVKKVKATRTKRQHLESRKVRSRINIRRTKENQ